MKKITIVILSCLFLTGGITSCSSKSKSDNSSEISTSDNNVKAPKEKYKKLAEDTNKQMPMPMPGGIRMDKVEAVSETEFKYYYTFTQEPTVSTEEFKRSTKPALTLALQNLKGEDIDMFRKDKMTLVYAYYKMDGSLYAEVVLNPEDYKK